MDWGSWSGFDGVGTYVIINKSSLHSLQMNEDSQVSAVLHTPNNLAQLWIIHKWAYGDIYVIENFFHQELLVARDTLEQVTGDKIDRDSLHGRHDIPERWCVEALWTIDKGMCALEPGRPVVFRSIKHPGYVLVEGVEDETEIILEDELEACVGKMQQWLLQRQPA